MIHNTTNNNTRILFDALSFIQMKRNPKMKCTLFFRKTNVFNDLSNMTKHQIPLNTQFVQLNNNTIQQVGIFYPDNSK